MTNCCVNDYKDRSDELPGKVVSLVDEVLLVREIRSRQRYRPVSIGRLPGHPRVHEGICGDLGLIQSP